jgi:ACS family tartrate transporter-like MFS transporter
VRNPTRVPAARSGEIAALESDVERRTRHHIAVRLLPFLFLLYIINYIDRTNLAYAALGMTHDLGFSDEVFGLCAGIFFVSYVALQIPGALMVELWSARRVISASMIAWGLLTMLTALVNTPGQLCVARFLLGVAEGGFFPGVIVYFSHWFVREDRAKAVSNFMCAIPLSAVVGSPFAGWIISHRWLGIQGWRWLFVLEGIPAIVFGIAAFYLLTDWPREASWLPEDQRNWIQERMGQEKPLIAKSMTIWQAFGSPTILLLSAVTFLDYFMLYCFIFWFPTVLKRQSGLSNLSVGLLAAIPYLVTFFAMQINGWHSDRQRERRWHAAIPMFVAALALAILMTQPHSVFLTVALFTLVCSGYSYLPAFWPLPSELLSQSASAAAVGFINAVGSVAGFTGPFLFGYLNTRTGSFVAGLGVMLAAAVGGGLLILLAPRTAPKAIRQPAKSLAV